MNAKCCYWKFPVRKISFPVISCDHWSCGHGENNTLNWRNSYFPTNQSIKIDVTIECANDHDKTAANQRLSNTRMKNRSQAGDVDELRSMKISPLSCFNFYCFKREQDTISKGQKCIINKLACKERQTNLKTKKKEI